MHLDTEFREIGPHDENGFLKYVALDSELLSISKQVARKATYRKEALVQRQRQNSIPV